VKHFEESEKLTIDSGLPGKEVIGKLLEKLGEEDKVEDKVDKDIAPEIGEKVE
jgi:hypothetical protein